MDIFSFALTTVVALVVRGSLIVSHSLPLPAWPAPRNSAVGVLLVSKL